MRKSDVLAHFGTQAAAARALGITRASVNGWPDVVPEGSAYRIERLTRGKLKVDPLVYDRIKGRSIPSARSHGAPAP